MAAKEILLITGGNTGLGYEIIKSLCSSSKSYTVLLGGRSFQKAQDAVKQLQSEHSGSKSTVEAVQVDVEDDQSIEECYKQVSSKHDRVDVLINNAGASFDPQIASGALTPRQAWNKSWDVNVTGTNILTSTFAPLLLKSSNPRLLFITSGTSSLNQTEDPNFHLNKAPEAGWPKQASFEVISYRAAKTGLNMVIRDWDRKFRNDGVKVFGVSPGWLATGLGPGAEVTKKMGAQDPSVGAAFVRDVVEGKRDGDRGKLVNAAGVQPY